LNYRASTLEAIPFRDLDRCFATALLNELGFTESIRQWEMRLEF
jgi:hypothetical protein